MQLKYAHLCDYAGEGARGKPIAVGIFERVVASDARPIGLPTIYLLVAIEAHVAEGTDHTAEIRLTNDQGEDKIPRASFQIRFRPQGPGHLMIAHLIAQFEMITLPDVGEYEFYVLVDGNDVASVPLIISPAPAR
jgi:hypothetical protein